MFFHYTEHFIEWIIRHHLTNPKTCHPGHLYCVHDPIQIPS